MIIESKGKEIASSGEIAPSSSDQLSFTQNTTGAFEYQCESHLDAMKDFVIYCVYYGIKESKQATDFAAQCLSKFLGWWVQSNNLKVESIKNNTV